MTQESNGSLESKSRYALRSRILVISTATSAILLLLAVLSTNLRPGPSPAKTFSLIDAVKQGTVTAGSSSRSLVASGVLPGHMVVLNYGGPTEEMAMVESVDPFQFGAPLKFHHEANEPLLVLRNGLPTVNQPPPVCSKAAASSQAPQLGIVEEGAAAIFDDLSPEEVKAVLDTIARNLGAASSSSTAAIGQNFVAGVGGVQLNIPSKQDALDYLDNHGPRPERFARVTIARPKINDVMEYRVGPITGTRTNPVVGTKAEELVDAGKVPYTKRPPDIKDPFVKPLVQAALQTLKPLLHLVFGPVFPTLSPFDFSKGLVQSLGIFPDLDSNLSSRVSMVKSFWLPSENASSSSLWLHPLPFVFRINQTGFDITKWNSYGFYFCGYGPWSSADELLGEFKSGKLPQCPFKLPNSSTSGRPGDWDQAGAAKDSKNPRTTKRGPRITYPDGPRWVVSAVPGGMGRKIEWMEWSFFASIRPYTGLSLWDIRFKGNRIAYELSLQESAALYGGAQGDQTYYLDTAMTGLGFQAPSLRMGIDCPESASPLYNGYSGDPYYESPRLGTHHGIRGASTLANEMKRIPSGCIFEEDSQKPMWSHISPHTITSTGIRGSQLRVRSIANSGNYDYINSAIFGLDGHIRWTTELAGYAETRWYNSKVNAWEREFSPLWHDYLAIPVHSHTLNVKVDLDIGAHNANSVEKLESVSGMPAASKEAGVLGSFPTKYLKHSYIANEGVGKSTMTAANEQGHPQVWRVANQDMVGPAFGSAPGYAIVPGEAAVNNLPKGHPLVEFVSFSKYAVVATQRHDAEEHSTSVYDAYAPAFPLTSLDKYMENHETLNQTDVVLWVTLAHEHIPRTEDIPLISNYEVGFNILPWNYFDGNAAMDLPEDPPTECLAHAL